MEYFLAVIVVFFLMIGAFMLVASQQGIDTAKLKVKNKLFGIAELYIKRK